MDLAPGSSLLYPVPGRSDMGIPAFRAAAGTVETASPVKNKAARQALIGDLDKFFPLITDRFLNMDQVHHNFLFGDTDFLGNIPQS